MVSAAEDVLNPLLEDNIIDKGYVLSISIYVEKGLAHDKRLIGKHKRACLYQGVPDYDNIVSLEVSGDQIERSPNIRDEQGRILVIVSAAGNLRDQILKTVKPFCVVA